MLYTCRRSEELLARGETLRTPSQHFSVDHTHPAQGEGALVKGLLLITVGQFLFRNEFNLSVMIEVVLAFSLFGLYVFFSALGRSGCECITSALGY